MCVIDSSVPLLCPLLSSYFQNFLICYSNVKNMFYVNLLSLPSECKFLSLHPSAIYMNDVICMPEYNGERKRHGGRGGRVGMCVKTPDVTI